MEDFIIVQVAKFSADSLDHALEQVKDAGAYLQNTRKGQETLIATYGQGAVPDLGELPPLAQMPEVAERLGVAA